MNAKKIYKQLIGIALLGISSNVLALPFILKNDSKYDIFYRCRSNAEAAANQNFDCNNNVLKAGESVLLDTKRRYSIKTAGTSSLMKYSSFYDVPEANYLMFNTLSRKDADKMERALREEQCTPVISVQAGMTYGWNFKISYTCMK